MLHCLCTGLPASHVILASCCWVWAVDSDASPDREKSLELIRYLVPDVFNGALVDSLSGRALSAAGLAASFLLEGNEQAQLTAPPTSICSVIKAQKPGWLLMSDPRESCDWKTFYIKCLSWCDLKNTTKPCDCYTTLQLIIISMNSMCCFYAEIQAAMTTSINFAVLLKGNTEVLPATGWMFCNWPCDMTFL